MNKKHIYTKLLLLSLAALPVMPVDAQNKKKNTPKVVYKQIVTTLVDKDNNPIEHAELIASEGAITEYSDAQGKVKARVKSKGVILIESLGYEDIVIDLSKGEMPKKLVMIKTPLFTSDKYNIVRADGATTNQQDLVSAISSVSGDELTSFADYSLSNALQGRIAGLTARKTNNGLANNVSDLFVRGLHGMDGNQALVIVDGMERSLDDLIAEEVATVEVLKDASAKILYGSRAANGVIVVTTKRGEANKRILRVNVESGVMSITRTPEYLNSAEYATLYNEARANDGLAPFYSDAQIAGYKNSTGAYDLLNPDVDYYDTFLQNQSLFTKASVELNGGYDRVRYAMTGSYLGGNGFESKGDRPMLNRLNIRGNLDIEVNDYISVYADAGARLETREWSAIDGASTFGRLSSVRPNEFPLTVSSEAIGIPDNEDGLPHFGASLRNPNNLLADMAYSGFTQERYITSQTKLGADVNLGFITEGLTAGGFIAFDNYSFFKEGQTSVLPTYAIRGTVDGVPFFQQMKVLEEGDNKKRLGDVTRRSLAWQAQLGYERAVGKHNLAANAAANYYNSEAEGATQDITNQFNTLRLNYGYDNRYIAEVTGALMGSNRFDANNRYFLSGSAGFAWVMTNESFMEDLNSISFLKFKASAGRIGFDRGTDYLLYKTAWNRGDDMKFGEKNVTTSKTTTFVRMASDLDWEYTDEVNVGVEAFMFKNRLRMEGNYFYELRKNIIGSTSASYQDILGEFVNLDNMGTVQNQGIDFSASWNDRKGNFQYSVGANLNWSVNKLLKWNEVDFKEEHMKQVGKPTDAMFGYHSLGLYGKDVALGSLVQTMGSYGEGDIAYADLNNDGIIDSRDKAGLGNSFPRVTLGLNVDLSYKGWGLYVLGTSELGVDTWKSNSYYWDNRGEGKYSNVALDRYHPQNNPTGTYPSLTTTQGTNNYVYSSHWIENGSFFRIKNVELSYTFDIRSPKLAIKKFRLFARGTDLAVFSTIKDLDPEVMNAGVTNYPVYTTLTGGFSATF